MKTVRAIVTTLIWTLAGCYLLPAILLHIPAIQEMVGEKVAEVVAETLKTNVRVGRVDVGFFNRLVVDGLRIDDQQRQPMIQASRVAAKDRPNLPSVWASCPWLTVARHREKLGSSLFSQ